MVDSSRNVDIILSLKPSPDNAKAAADVATAIEKAQQRAMAASAKNERHTAAAAKKQADAAKKEAERAAKAEQAAMDKVMRNRIKLVAKVQALEAKKTEAVKREAEKAAKAEAAELDKRKRAYESAMAQHAHAMEQVESGHIRALESGAKLGRGILDVARASAILGISSEEDLEKFARTYAMIEGAFGGMKGGIDIISGAAQMMRDLQSATRGAAVAQVALNNAQAASTGIGMGGAGNAASGAVQQGAGRSIMGNLAPAVIGLAKLAGVSLAVYEAGTFLARSFGVMHDRTESFIGALVSWRKAVNEAAKAEKKTAEMTSKLGQDMIARQAGRFSVGSEMRDLASRRDAATLGEDEAARLQKLRAMSAREQAEAALKGLKNVHKDVSAEDRAKLQEQAAGALKQAHLDILAAEERGHTIAKAKVDAARETLKMAREQLAVNDKAIEQEKERQKTRLAAFAQLNAAQQQGLQDIASRIEKGGVINKRDAELLQGTGFGGSLLNDYFAQQGTAAGGQRVVDTLEGGRENLSNLEQERHSLMEAANRATREERDSKEALRQKTDELVSTFDRMNVVADQFVEFMEKIRNGTANNQQGARSADFVENAGNAAAANGGGNL